MPVSRRLQPRRRVASTGGDHAITAGTGSGSRWFATAVTKDDRGLRPGAATDIAWCYNQHHGELEPAAPELRRHAVFAGTVVIFCWNKGVRRGALNCELPALLLLTGDWRCRSCNRRLASPEPRPS